MQALLLRATPIRITPNTAPSAQCAQRGKSASFGRSSLAKPCSVANREFGQMSRCWCRCCFKQPELAAIVFCSVEGSALMMFHIKLQVPHRQFWWRFSSIFGCSMSSLELESSGLQKPINWTCTTVCPNTRGFGSRWLKHELRDKRCMAAA